MPGITYAGTNADAQRVGERNKRSAHPSPPRALTHSDSYYAAGPMTQTTAYGVNGPQWTAGQPPPLIYSRSPYAHIPLPPLTAHPVALHPLLTPHGTASILWTVCANPISAACSQGLAARDQYHWKSLPAVPEAPDVPSLTIVIGPKALPSLPRLPLPPIPTPPSLTSALRQALHASAFRPAAFIHPPPLRRRVPASARRVPRSGSSRRHANTSAHVPPSRATTPVLTPRTTPPLVSGAYTRHAVPHLMRPASRA